MSNDTWENKVFVAWQYKTLMSTKIVRNVYRKFKPNLIVCDFDGTLTRSETITPLIRLAQRNWSPAEHDNFKEHMSWYITKHNLYQKELLANLTEYRKQLQWDVAMFVWDGSSQWDVRCLQSYFNNCDELDLESLHKLNSNGKYLANMKCDELSDVFKEYVACDAMDLLSEFVQDGCMVKILSHNWSSRVICNALNQIVKQDDIICNELEFDDHDISTGRLSLKCVTSIDKLNYLHKWTNDSTYCMYVGDAWGDMLASCCSDISVWMQTPYNQAFLNVANDKYLMNKEQTDLLFVADSWT
eukprot:269639_1